MDWSRSGGMGSRRSFRRRFQKSDVFRRNNCGIRTRQHRAVFLFLLSMLLSRAAVEADKPPFCRASWRGLSVVCSSCSSVSIQSPCVASIPAHSGAKSRGEQARRHRQILPSSHSTSRYVMKAQSAPSLHVACHMKSEAVKAAWLSAEIHRVLTG